MKDQDEWKAAVREAQEADGPHSDRRITMWVDSRRLLLGLEPRHADEVTAAVVEHFGIYSVERVRPIVERVLARGRA